MANILSQLKSPKELHGMDTQQLEQVASEIRETLCGLLSNRSAHFASNLGVVELCLALHSTFDFSYDRLIWDTGHKIYPQKLITGRYDEFPTIRTRGGLMGYPNPAESEYDLFVTGHAGCSVSTMVGIRSGDDLHGETDRGAAHPFSAGVSCHHDDNVTKIRLAPIGIRERAMVHDLKHDVENIWVSFFHLIQK